MVDRHKYEPVEDEAFHRRVARGFGQFMHTQSSGAIVMLIFTVLALALANSPLWEQYAAFWELHAGVLFEDWTFEQSLLHWIDDALMAAFFFVVGLEIKREVIVGELSTLKKAALPILAAVGGMVVPALLYLSVNAGTEYVDGWGIPMATDIAFALGVLALLGSRIPSPLKVFLAALAIVDDIGAILVIALFYTEEIATQWLFVALAVVLVMALMNYLGIDGPTPYFIMGMLLWFAMFNSGIHATIAGVMAAFTIPAKAKLSPMEFTIFARDKLDEIEACHVEEAHILSDPQQQLCALEIRDAAVHSAAPLQRLEFGMHPFTTFLVLPLFAFANAGVRVVESPMSELFGTAATGIALGLIVGKPVGIALFSWLAVRMGISALPQGVRWSHIVGAGLLGGIGFTMSIFVSSLAFTDSAALTEAKAAILVSSVIAGVLGYSVLRFLGRPGVKEAS